MRKYIVVFLSFLLLVVTGFGIYFFFFQENDSVRFKKEYEKLNGEVTSSNTIYRVLTIDKENPMVYAGYDDIMNLLQGGTGIIYFGFPECPWCRALLPVFFDVLEEENVSKVYYFNAYDIRDEKHLDDSGNVATDKEGSQEYYNLIDALYEYLDSYDGLKNDTIKRLYFPTLVFVKNGMVVGFHSGTLESHKDVSQDMTEEQVTDLKKVLHDYIEKVYASTSCQNKNC